MRRTHQHSPTFTGNEQIEPSSAPSMASLNPQFEPRSSEPSIWSSNVSYIVVPGSNRSSDTFTSFSSSWSHQRSSPRDTFTPVCRKVSHQWSCNSFESRDDVFVKYMHSHARPAATSRADYWLDSDDIDDDYQLRMGTNTLSDRHRNAFVVMSAFSPTSLMSGKKSNPDMSDAQSNYSM